MTQKKSSSTEGNIWKNKFVQKKKKESKYELLLTLKFYSELSQH